MSTTAYLIRLWRHSLLLYIGESLASTVQWGFGILVLGMLVRAIFDAITVGPSASADVYTLCAVFMVLNVVGNMLVNPMSSISEEVLTGVLQSRLQRNLFKTMLDHRPVQGGPSPGETLNRYRDDVEATVKPLLLVAEMTGMLVALGAAVYVMASIDPLITVAAFLPAIIILTGTRLLGNRIESLRRASREATSRVSGALGELLNSVQALQVAGAEERSANHFEALGERRRKADMKEGLLEALIEGLNGSVVTISTGVILLAAAHLMRDGSFSVGDFALFAFVAGGTNTGYAVRWIADFLASLRRARVSFARLAELVPEAPPQSLVQGGSLHLWGPIPEEPYPAKTGADALSSLEVRGLTHLRKDTGSGIQDIGLTLPRGSFTVVTGRIGSGKTTLLEVLLGLLPMDRGEVLWNGRRVEDLHTFLVPPRCAYTPQAPWLYSDTVRSNILMGLGRRRTRAGRRRSPWRSGARRGRAGARTGHGGGAARRAAIGRAGAEDGGCPDVRSRPGATGLRRPVQRPGRHYRGDALGAAVRAGGRDQPRCIAPQDRPGPRRQHNRAQGRRRGGGGQTGRPARVQPGDAPPPGRRREPDRAPALKRSRRNRQSRTSLE